MRRPQTLNDLDPLDAAGRVGDYLTPQEHGGWRIKGFTVDAEAAMVDRLRSFGDGGGRFTPEGSYLMLANEDGVMMSNTPDELTDHASFMEVAEGRVLVHGLGLGCVVSGLLANDKVDHIDVVELSEDVIAMVGPGYEDEPRVTIHHGNALTYEWPSDARWDYAWHDIWQTISCDNLNSDSAENGVGYDALLTRFASIVTYQGAWALDTSLIMEAAYELADERAEEWAERWRRADPAGRRELMIDWYAQQNPITRALGGEGSEATRRQSAEWLLSQEDDDERYQRDEAKFLIDAPPLVPEVRDQLPARLATYYASLDLVAERVHGLACQPLIYERTH